MASTCSHCLKFSHIRHLYDADLVVLSFYRDHFLSSTDQLYDAWSCSVVFFFVSSVVPFSSVCEVD